MMWGKEENSKKFKTDDCFFSYNELMHNNALAEYNIGKRQLKRQLSFFHLE